MKFIRKNIFTLCSLALIIAMGFCGEAWAQSTGTVSGSSIMSAATGKVRDVFTSVKTITYILGGFGLIGIAYSAIIGKVKWSWFAGLAVGLAILASAGAIVEYATGTSESGLDTDFKG